MPPLQSANYFGLADLIIICRNPLREDMVQTIGPAAPEGRGTASERKEKEI